MIDLIHQTVLVSLPAKPWESIEKSWLKYAKPMTLAEVTQFIDDRYRMSLEMYRNKTHDIDLGNNDSETAHAVAYEAHCLIRGVVEYLESANIVSPVQVLLYPVISRWNLVLHVRVVPS